MAAGRADTRFRGIGWAQGPRALSPMSFYKSPIGQTDNRDVWTNFWFDTDYTTPPALYYAMPATGVLDDFNRADADVGANWTTVNDGGSYPRFNVFSNQMDPAGDSAWAFWNPTTFQMEQEVWVHVISMPGIAGAHYELSARIVSATGGNFTGYFLHAESGLSTIWRATNSSYTQIGTSAVGISTGDYVLFRCMGAVLTGYKASTPTGPWTQLVTATDGTYMVGGYLGVFSSSSTGLLDDFGGGTVFSSIEPPPPVTYVRFSHFTPTRRRMGGRRH